MTAPSLSVLMPNYNHSKYIGEALDAVVNQSLKPVEIIVGDDASTDNSVEIIEKYVEKYPFIRLVRNETNLGVIDNGNKLLDLARGEYVYFAAADDKVLAGFFEKTMGLLAQYPEAVFCCSDPVFFDCENGVVRKNRFGVSSGPCYFTPEMVVKSLQQSNFWMAGHTTIVKRTALREPGVYIPELKWYIDWFAYFVMAFRRGVCYIPEPLAAMRVLSSSYSASGKNSQSQQRQVLLSMLRLLNRPEYDDVRHMFRNSGVLSQLEPDLFQIFGMSDCRKYISRMLLRKTLKGNAKKMLSVITPSFLRQIYAYRKTKKLKGTFSNELPSM